MRIGFNPNKDKVQLENDYFHQVIIPVYIPNQEGYFKDSFQVLRLCIESLLKTCHQQTYFTIVNNGSCAEIINYLNNLHQEHKIHEIVHTTNIGKLNAVLKGINGHDFQLITVTDADVMFLNDWQLETYKIFDNFPKTGVVSPTPSPKVFKHLTYNSILSNLFSNNLGFTQTKNPNALLKFAESIGNVNFYNEHHLTKNLTITKNNVRAVIGAGHFVATYKGCIFEKINLKFTKFNLGGDSETVFLDKPAVDQGFWRLSTEDNFAYHLGNVTENWMFETFETIGNQSDKVLQAPKKGQKNYSGVKLKDWLFKSFVSKKLFWKWFLKHKGLSKTEIQEY